MSKPNNNSNKEIGFIEKIQNVLIEFSDFSRKTNFKIVYSLLFIIVIVLIFGYYIFFFNPYKILNFIHIPIIIIFLLVLFYFIHFYFYINKLKKDSSNSVYINVKYETINYTTLYLKLILLCIVVFITFIILFNLSQLVLISSLNYSFFLTLVILFIIIAFIDSYFKISNTISDNNLYIEFLKTWNELLCMYAAYTTILL